MTVYATPWNPATRECTGGAVPTGFSTVAEVRAIFGPADSGGTRWAAYGDTVYSDIIFNYLETPQHETPT